LKTAAEDIACCFDEESRAMLDDYRKKGLSKTASTLLSSLKARGIAESTILELGCGVGALTLELAKCGATSAIGMDLSPKMVGAARNLIYDAGLSSIVKFELGDAAVAKLGRADIVVLDSVLCCYPDVSALVENSSSASTRYYAVAFPDDRRPLTKLLRAFLPLQSLFLRRGSFRFFIHPTAKVIRRLEERGFTRVFESNAGHLWGVFVFAAPRA
jgi:SAM-dependent methyltransferase